MAKRLLKNAGLLRDATFLRKPHQHHRLETDDYFSGSDCDSDLDQRPLQAAPVRRVLQAKTALPQDISFTVPDSLDSEAGADVVCIQGPHGPLRVPLPKGAKPGEQCSIRLGPPAQYHVTVPEGGKPGDAVKFSGQAGEELTATVPEGKKPGEQFEVSLPVLLIQVPQGAKPGTEVMYEAPDRQNRCVRVPSGCSPGHFFPVLILPPGHDVLVADAAWPVELSFHAPAANVKPGQPVCVQGPHGPMMVPLPNDVKPGQQCFFRLGPRDTDGQCEVTVPEDAKPGDGVSFKGANDETFHAVVPEGKKPGDIFQASLPTAMVRMPAGAEPGSEVMFQMPGEQQVRFTRIPNGLAAGHYFPVLLQKRPEETKETKSEEAAEKQEETSVEDANLVG